MIKEETIELPGRESPIAEATNPTESTIAPSAPHSLNDTYGADRFIARYRKDWRFDHDRGVWLTFSADRWRPAEHGALSRLLIERARDFLVSVSETTHASVQAARSWGKYCLQNKGLHSVRSVLKELPPIAVKSSDWDVDPLLVGVPNGIIDLRTGNLVTSDRTRLISLSLGVPYEPGREVPTMAEMSA